MQKHTVYPGDRVEVTADQSYWVTWDDVGFVGEAGFVLDIGHEELAYNLMSGTRDAAPYRLMLDDGRDVYVAEVKPLTEVN